MPINNSNLQNQSENTFSLEENLRHRDYYEKYYEDLAEHASKMDKKGQHEIEEADREEMEYVSGVLGKLTREKFEKYDKQQTNEEINEVKETAQAEIDTDREIENQSSNEITQQDIHQGETQEKEQTNQNQVEEIPKEDLIPVDKSHFTEEALEAQARADEQLAAEEAAMDEKIKQYYTEQEQYLDMQTAENQMNQANVAFNEQTKSASETLEASQEIETASEEEDYYYGYGM